MRRPPAGPVSISIPGRWRRTLIGALLADLAAGCRPRHHRRRHGPVRWPARGQGLDRRSRRAPRPAGRLVIDARHQAQSMAALVHGFASFRPGLAVAGVILNRVASDRHERDSCRRPCGDAPSLGVCARDNVTGTALAPPRIWCRPRKIRDLKPLSKLLPQRLHVKLDLDTIG